MAAVLTSVTAPHRPVPVVATRPGDWTALGNRAAGVPATSPVDDSLVQVADRLRPLLPETLRRSLAGLRLDPGPTGALLVRGVPTGTVPATPAAPTEPTGKDRVSELVLLAVARSLGEPVGYRPEHGGDLVQNLLPVRAAAGTQTSTSSLVDLEFHTETAFHPHRPHHLLLSCLRGDATARTYLSSVRELLDDLSDDDRRTLGQIRFRTRVDASFGGTPGMDPGPPVAVLSGDPAAPTLLFDADLMVGVDPEATRALDRFRRMARERRLAVVLEPGDLLVVDNHVCIHGRSAFTARYDGTDRWIQRSFVVDDLAPSAPDRTGRIIDTRFA